MEQREPPHRTAAAIGLRCGNTAVELNLFSYDDDDHHHHYFYIINYYYNLKTIGELRFALENSGTRRLAIGHRRYISVHGEVSDGDHKTDHSDRMEQRHVPLSAFPSLFIYMDSQLLQTLPIASPLSFPPFSRCRIRKKASVDLKSSHSFSCSFVLDEEGRPPSAMFVKKLVEKATRKVILPTSSATSASASSIPVVSSSVMIHLLFRR